MRANFLTSGRDFRKARPISVADAQADSLLSRTLE